MINPTDYIDKKELKIRTKTSNNNEDLARVESCVDQLLDGKMDITNEYNNWVNIGLSLASLGEAGRIHFRNVSSIYSGYDQAECDKKFDDFLETGNGDISIATFFHECKIAGIAPQKEKSLLVSNSSNPGIAKNDGGGQLFGHAMTLDYKIKFHKPSLTIKDHVVINVGNFSVISALPGMGKSNICELLAVSFISNKYSLGIDTWGIDVHCLQDKKYLHIDTENPDDDSKISLDRIYARLGKNEGLTETNADEKRCLKGLTYWCIMETDSIEKRWKTLEYFLSSGDYEFINLDGFLDFSKGGLNNELETFQCVQRLRGHLVKYNCSATLTLHPNKGTDMMAGHLGAFLYRYTKGSFLIRNNTNDPVVKELTVDFGMGKLSKADRATFPNVYFQWDKDQGLVVETEEPEARGNFNRQAIEEIFREHFINTGEEKVKSTQLKKRYAEITGTEKRTASGHVQNAEKNGFIDSTGKTKNKEFYLKKDND